ncbi:hypothetical protein CERSUDRAFT_124842 [Gelatoporia subvermispora B]|uniref:DUF6533 domain-containing protein n=1 Tax=Ceriporiopsis subvermispora (strain B) TaxID=914234 RepID=M2QEU3_CERS8|nr:hypothetical protein CERSUDRAFT_124842 [Gelatoporia subvermispora B]
MSEIYGPLADQIVSLIGSTVIGNYCIVASTAIVLYDHLCTIPNEAQLIWGRKPTATIILFHTNRWLIVIWMMMNILECFFPFRTVVSCSWIYYTDNVLDLCLLILWAAFSTIRVHALSGGNHFLPAIVALLSLVPVGTNAYGGFYRNQLQLETVPILGNGCLDATDMSETTTMKFEICTRVCVILADAVVLAVTWSRTWDTVRRARAQNVKTPFMTMLLRDVFRGLLSLNVLSIVGRSTNVCVWVLLERPSTEKKNPRLSSIVITHFLLDLRQLTHSSDDANAPSQRSSLRFHSFVDNMGESLAHGSEDDGDDDIVWDDDGQHSMEHLPARGEMMSSLQDGSRVPIYERVSGYVRETEDPEESTMTTGALNV